MRCEIILLVAVFLFEFLFCKSLYYYGEEFTFSQAIKQKLNISEPIDSCCLLKSTTFCVSANKNLYAWGLYMNETLLTPTLTGLKLDRLFRSYAEFHCTAVNGSSIMRLFSNSITAVGPPLPFSLKTAERGAFHALFLFNNGEVYCRGFNNYGQVRFSRN